MPRHTFTPILTEEQTAALRSLAPPTVANQPAAPAAKPKREKKRRKGPPEFLSEDEVDRLFTAIGNDVRSQAMFHLIYFRGLRASEIALLRIEDYRANLGRSFVRRLKGSRSGDYHLMPSERTWLNRWVRIRGKQPGPLFPSRQGGPVTRWRIYALMKRYCKIAGIANEKAHPHALKHSCGTHLSSREKDIAVVQDHLGHANIQNTIKYVSIASKRRDEFGERMEDQGWGR